MIESKSAGRLERAVCAIIGHDWRLYRGAKLNAGKRFKRNRVRGTLIKLNDIKRLPRGLPYSGSLMLELADAHCDRCLANKVFAWWVHDLRRVSK